jgi:phage shock protein PspC (stress-responsive transcriptional regulator)
MGLLYTMDMTNKKLYRNNEDSIIAGVCGGLADYFEVDVTLIRVIFVLLLIGGGSGFLIYLVLWLITPLKNEEETDFKEEAGELLEKTAKKTKTMAKEIKKEVKVSKHRSGGVFGLILMFLGVLILIDKIVPVYIRWDYVWPIILVVIGAYLVFRD